MRYTLLMGLKIQYYHDIISPQIDPQIQYDLSQILSKLSYRN